MMNKTWICTLIMAFPMKVAKKKVKKGIFKLPQVIPAKSKRGLGIDASKRIVTKAWFLMILKINNLILSSRESSLVLFFCSYSISYNCLRA